MELTRPQAEILLNNYYLTGSGVGGVFVENKPFIRGGGFGDILSSISKVALPLLKQAGRYVGRKGLSLLANTARDAIDGKNIGQALKSNATSELENATYDLTENLAQKINSKRKKVKKGRPRKKGRSKMW